MAIDVSIVLNAHREGGLLLRTLASLQSAVAYAQERHIKTELILVLDRPDAATQAAVTRSDFSTFFAHQIVEIAEGSLGLARNAGCSRAAGRYLCLCDGDDLYSANYIRSMFEQAESRESRSVLYAEWMIAFGHRHFVIQHVDLDCLTPMAMIDVHPFVSSVFFNRRLFDEVKFSDVRLTDGYAYEDWHFNAEAVASGWKFYAVPQAIRFYRQHSNNLLTRAVAVSVGQIPPSRLFEPPIFVRTCEKSVEQLARGTLPRAPLTLRAALCDPRLRQLISAAAEIDPQIDFETIRNGDKKPSSGMSNIAVGMAYYEVCQYLGEDKFDYVFVISNVTRGLTNLITGLTSLDPNVNILVLMGEMGGVVDSFPFAPNVMLINLSIYLHSSKERGIDLISLKLIQACAPQSVLCLQEGTYAFRFFRSYGRALSLHDVVLVIPGQHQTLGDHPSIVTSETFAFVSDHETLIATFVTDSPDVAHYLTARTCTQGKWHVLPFVYEPIIAREVAAEAAQDRRPNALTILGDDQHEHVERLFEIADALKEIDSKIVIDVWGAVTSPSLTSRLTRYSNVRYKGMTSPLARKQRYDGFAILYVGRSHDPTAELVQAATLGLPLVVAAAGKIPDFIEHQKTALLVDERRGEDIASRCAESLTSLATDQTLCARLVEAAYDRLVRDYSSERYLASLARALVRGSSETDDLPPQPQLFNVAVA